MQILAIVVLMIVREVCPEFLDRHLSQESLFLSSILGFWGKFRKKRHEDKTLKEADPCEIGVVRATKVKGHVTRDSSAFPSSCACSRETRTTDEQGTQILHFTPCSRRTGAQPFGRLRSYLGYTLWD
jgi:hypothetical protein